MNIAARVPGISAFMRCRNGADFVEATIRSHLEYYDELVVVYNQCTDDTPNILARLVAEFGPKMRVFHYTDRVQPLGSAAHANTPGDSPESMVNYSNFALAQTRFQVVVKLDDDHLAIPREVEKMVNAFRNGQVDMRFQHCFSGFNIARAKDGTLGIPAFDPVVGGGDHGYFVASEDTRFYYDKRFERFGRGEMRRRFAGFFYWHLKYLKQGQGFVNYELNANPTSRYARKKQQFDHSSLLDLPQTCRDLSPGIGAQLKAALAEKFALKFARDKAALNMFEDMTLIEALDQLSPGWTEVPRLGTFVQV
ncbi:MAG: glycosyltransferase family 2 protein [Alphaproteobacteria bacterium]|nr:glycosyltransferase family 2 protein [Alphaproteobacteria bacterium]